MKRVEVPSTDQEWFDVIRECRSGSLSDREWCKASGISRNSLYYHIRKLRLKGYDIPQPSRNRGTCDKQEVIPLTFVEGGSFPEDCHSDFRGNGMIAASVSAGSIRVDIHDGASGATIRDILSALGGLPC